MFLQLAFSSISSQRVELISEVLANSGSYHLPSGKSIFVMRGQRFIGRKQEGWTATGQLDVRSFFRQHIMENSLKLPVSSKPSKASVYHSIYALLKTFAEKSTNNSNKTHLFHSSVAPKISSHPKKYPSTTIPTIPSPRSPK